MIFRLTESSACPLQYIIFMYITTNELKNIQKFQQGWRKFGWKKTGNDYSPNFVRVNAMRIMPGNWESDVSLEWYVYLDSSVIGGMRE